MNKFGQIVANTIAVIILLSLAGMLTGLSIYGLISVWSLIL